VYLRRVQKLRPSRDGVMVTRPNVSVWVIVFHLSPPSFSDAKKFGTTGKLFCHFVGSACDPQQLVRLN
jgi:hypothetical protein